jgi:hypothetical protein
MKRRRSSGARTPLPGEAVMLGLSPQRRSTPRVAARRTVRLSFESPCEEDRVALMRDISTKGVFFYSDFSPSVGDELDFVLEFVSVSDNARFHFKGHVIRVEHPSPGCAPGVAVSFHPHERRALWR